MHDTGPARAHNAADLQKRQDRSQSHAWLVLLTKGQQMTKDVIRRTILDVFRRRDLMQGIDEDADFFDLGKYGLVLVCGTDRYGRNRVLASNLRGRPLIPYDR